MIAVPFPVMCCFPLRLSVPLSLFPSRCLSLNPFVCLSMSLVVSVLASECLCLPFSPHFPFVSVIVSVSLVGSLCLSNYVSLCLSLSLCLSVSLSLCLSVFLSSCLFVSYRAARAAKKKRSRQIKTLLKANASTE